MTLLLRTGLAVGAAALAVVSSQTSRHPAPPNGTDPLLAADSSTDRPSPVYGGLAALSVGGLGIFARLRRR